MEPVRVRGLPQPGRTLVMGVVNVTPDSFSDGGDSFATEDAIRHGLRLFDEGADLVDVGGESTRPGADRLEPADEQRRVLPVVEALTAAGVAVSVDTMRAEVARAAVGAGAILVNDVSGGLADDDMITAVADLGVAYVCMHWRGPSADMQQRAQYDDVVHDVLAELGSQVARCRAGGLASDQLIIDPGIGFAKYAEHNWELLRRIEELEALDLPLLIGVSRKSFLGHLLGRSGRPRPPKERDDASLALTTWLAGRGVWGVRVHTGRPHRDAIAVVEQLRPARLDTSGGRIGSGVERRR